eukprot:TRINITY_DN8561_c5_g1_i1.p1 TRINITY_DN8561_c5_g1~~TRINITY_DN8561_c5_g1_i1.p1  ORF type:complete len:746 (+),score=210.41 TRINITY_DN8561_c5_g1_i1:83-2239(+)
MPIKIVGEGEDKVEVIPLGSGSEVGRSSVVVKFKGKSVMFDCGVHPAMDGLDSLPFFDAVDASEIDLVLVTHFHLDHCGAVPYFLEETTFKGKVIMTHPTKKIFRMVMQDFIRVTQGSHDICTEQWLESSLEKIETLDYHQEGTHNGVKYHSYNAGHVLGAGMWMIDISGVKILYTGDFSREPDRHLMGAETPVVSPDILIVEATYGIQVHDQREERERKFTKWVHDIVAREGRCLLPMFALGRAQELLLILDDYWAQRKELHQIPIYYASSLAKRCNTVFESYISLMNDTVQKQYDVLKHKRNPFQFKHITLLKDLKSFDDNGPCVVLASPGMLQSGVSRELFEKWCSDEKNGVVIAGYCVANTLARTIQSSPSEIQREDGKVLPLRMSVHTVSFSAHSDFAQTKEFVTTLGTKQVVLVHGDSMNMNRLRDRLCQDLPYLTCHTPTNTQCVSIPFQPLRTCKVIGSVAQNPAVGSHVSGVMVMSHDFQHTLVAPQDLPSYTALPVAEITQAVFLPLPKYYPYLDVKDHLAKYFEGVSIFKECMEVAEATSEDIDEGSSQVLVVGGYVKISIEQGIVMGKEVTTVGVSWPASRYNDIVADSCCLALIALLSPSGQKMPQDAADDIFRLRCMHKMLGQHFLGVHLHVDSKTFSFEVDNTPVTVVAPFTVTTTNETIQQRVESVIHLIFLTLWPVPENFGWCGCGQDHDHSDKRRKTIEN